MSDLLGMHRAVMRSTRSTTEKMVLLAIIDHWSEASPEPWPSVPTLSKLCSLGRTAVLDALAALERDGVMSVRRVAGRPNRYDLSRVVASLAAPAEPVREADRSGPRTSPSAGRHQSVWRTGPVRLADPKDPKKEPNKEATVVHAREANVAERAKLVLSDAREAQRQRPQDWPEARRIAEAYGRATGNLRPLSELQRDSGLRAILVLFAAAYSVADVEWVAANVPGQAWWRAGQRVRGLGSLSVEVVARALAERDAPRRLVVAPRPRAATSEDRRIHRNTLLENAQAGRYGAEIRRIARTGVRLRELADDLERREAVGDLRLMRCGLPASDAPGIATCAAPTSVDLLPGSETPLRRASMVG